MIRILVAVLTLLCAVPAQAIDLQRSDTQADACTKMTFPESGGLGINRAARLLCFRTSGGALASAYLLDASSTPTFASITTTAGASVTGTFGVAGVIRASGTLGYAPITVVGNPGSGWGTSVEWQGNAVVVGFDGNNNVPKIQSRAGGTVGGALGTGFGNIGLNPEGGSVGVGTTNPAAKLDVVGTLRGQFLSLSASPTASNIPASYWTVVKRTDDGSVKICGNDAGTIKCAAMQ